MPKVEGNNDFDLFFFTVVGISGLLADAGLLRYKYQDEAVAQVVEFMSTYSISQEDFETIMELSKFKVTSPCPPI